MIMIFLSYRTEWPYEDVLRTVDFHFRRNESLELSLW